jgi:hypothetical protein
MTRKASKSRRPVLEARPASNRRQRSGMAGRPGKVGSLRSYPEPTEYEELVQIAKISPRAAIAEAWWRVEVAAKEVARVTHIDASSKSSLPLVVTSLAQKGLLSEAAEQAFERLHQFQLKAVHSQDRRLGGAAVDRHLKLACRLGQELFDALYAAVCRRG